MHGWVRVLAIAAVTVLALACGVASVAVSRAAAHVGGVPLPWGMALAVLAPGALFRAAGSRLGRAGALLPAAAWLAPVVVAMLPRPEGDILVGGDAYGLVFVVLALVLVLWTAASSGRR